MRATPSDNRFVEKKSSSAGVNSASHAQGPFVPGVLVVVTLGSPREKFWGMILALAPEGLSLSGADLASFEDIAAMVKEGEPFTPAVVFFPMHRIERVDLDASDGTLSSLSQRFHAKTGLDPSSALALRPNDQAGRDALAVLRSPAPKENA
jgi:hypothetical protein